MKIQLRILREKLNKDDLITYRVIEEYFERYCSYFNLDIKDIVAAHEKFLEKYNQDLKDFISTQKFPHELGSDHFDISREEYDMALLLSSLLLEHRFKIMDLVHKADLVKGVTLIVGLGSGMELYLINTKESIDAYDVKISDFVKSSFNQNRNINLYEKTFESNKSLEKYSNIFLIEFLEHIESPYDFLSDISDSMVYGGRLFATTIKNVPQFDHLHNFESDREFERKISSFGLAIKRKEVLNHHYFQQNIDANNIFYFIEK